MPKVIKWEEYKEELYQRYIVEGNDMATVVESMENDFNLKVTERSIYRKFMAWGFNKNQRGLIYNHELISLVKGFWLNNYTPANTCHALTAHGYTLTTRQLKSIRLHPSINLLTRRSPLSDPTSTIHRLNTLIEKHQESGQAIRWGISYLAPLIRSEGLFISEHDLQYYTSAKQPDIADSRLQTTLRRRGQYQIKGPNRVWSIDGHDKLSRFGFQIYGCIDAYSRYIVWCYVGHSNRTAVSVNKQFLTMVAEFDLFPKLIRFDMGLETSLLCNSQLVLRRAEKPDLPFNKAYAFGTSTRNQRIESWWNLLANAQTDTWRAIFAGYEEQGYFNGGQLDQALLQFIYMPLIRQHIHTFVQEHNNHRIRRQRTRSHYLPTGKPSLMYFYPPANTPNYGTRPDPAILAALQSDVNSYSLDEYLPTTTIQLFTQFLQDGGYPTVYSFSDDHKSAYIYLRERVASYIELENGSIELLERPRGAEEWLRNNNAEILAEQQLEVQRRQEEKYTLNLIATDDESDDIERRMFEEEHIERDGLGMEEELILHDSDIDGQFELDEDYIDDAIVLDVPHIENI